MQELGGQRGEGGLYSLQVCENVICTISGCLQNNDTKHYDTKKAVTLYKTLLCMIMDSIDLQEEVRVKEKGTIHDPPVGDSYEVRIRVHYF